MSTTRNDVNKNNKALNQLGVGTVKTLSQF